MALPDDEQRRLEEIESGLAEEDPRLARQFARGRPVPASTLAAVVVAALLMLAAGVVIMVLGARLGTPLVVVIGLVIAVVVPLLAWLARRKALG